MPLPDGTEPMQSVGGGFSEATSYSYVTVGSGRLGFVRVKIACLSCDRDTRPRGDAR